MEISGLGGQVRRGSGANFWRNQSLSLLAAASERIAGAAERATLRIWDTASGAIVGTYTNAFGPLAFSSDGQLLVSTRLNGGVVAWDLGSGRSAAEIEENFTWIGSLALSPDGRLLGNPVHSFLFSPNGEYLAITRDSETRGERRVKLWRAPSFEEIIAAEQAKARKE